MGTTIGALWLRLGVTLGSLGLLLVLGEGCVLKKGRRAPERAVIGSLELTNSAGRPQTMEVLGAGVMRFADIYATTVAEGVDALLAQVSTPEARIEAVRWKLGQATAAFIDAAGAKPPLNALDLVVLASISRMVMEDEVNRVFGPPALPLLQRHRQLETNAWLTLRRVLRPAQEQELRSLIQQWRREHPDQRYVTTARFRELAAVGEKTSPQAGSASSSLLGWFSLDPLAGLDPATAALQETRQFAERAMYYGQRLPTLMNWQAQLLSLQLAAQPEAKAVLGDAARFSRSTETFAQTTAQLPKLVNEQREAAIRQVLDGLAAERTNWLAGLEADAPKARTLLSEARQTLDAGSQTAKAVRDTLQTFNELVRTVSPAQTNPAPTASPSHPFNAVEFGEAAAELGRAAKEVNTLLLTANQSAPGLSRQLTADFNHLLNRTFLVGSGLMVVFLGGTVVAGLAYRELRHRGSPEPRAAAPEFPLEAPGHRNRTGPPGAMKANEQS